MDRIKIEVPPGVVSPPSSRSNSPEKYDVENTYMHLSKEDIEAQKIIEKSNEKTERQIVEEMNAKGKNVLHQQLMHLLEKSSVYTTFLLNRLITEENDRKAKEAETKKSIREKGKRKRNAVSDLIDKKDLVKKQRLNEEGDSQDKVSSEIGCSQEVIKELQPKLLTGAVLRDYQLYGVNWIKSLYDNGMNGILADEMGLGKTIQSIGLIAALMQHHVRGPFLIVVPLSTLYNWKLEFQKFAPEIDCFVFHGSKDERIHLAKRFKKKNGLSIERIELTQAKPVVLTSYEMILLEPSFFETYDWKYLIVDEGHRLKNMNCRLIKQLKRLRTDNRLLLTGTPLQNNLAELWTLLNFILPSVFDDLDSFQTLFDFSGTKDEIIANEKEGQVLNKLHQILKPFLLRRMKDDVELDIPKKTEVHVYAIMTAKQKEYYQAIVEYRIHQLLNPEKYMLDAQLMKNEKGLRKTKKINYCESFKEVLDEDGKVDFSYWKTQDDVEVKPIRNITKLSVQSKLQMRWVQLKKTVNHPYLLSYPCDENGYAVVDDNILTYSGKMLLLDRMLPKLTEGEHKVLIFSTMTKLLDIIEDYLVYSDWNYCRLDGSKSVSERQAEVDRFQNDPDYRIFLVSTRAGGLGLNLMAADSVVLMDSDWNPQCDLQAQARAHRIGQKRKVMVYRFLLKNTIDQKIVERAIEKRVLEKMVIHKGKFKRHDTGGTENITENDLHELFKCDALEALKSRFQPQDVLSDKDLEALTDRRDTLPSSDAYTVVEEVSSKY